MLGRKAVSLLAQEDVLDSRSDKAGILLELPDLERLGALDRDGLRVFLPEMCLIFVQK